MVSEVLGTFTYKNIWDVRECFKIFWFNIFHLFFESRKKRWHVFKILTQKSWSGGKITKENLYKNKRYYIKTSIKKLTEKRGKYVYLSYCRNISEQIANMLSYHRLGVSFTAQWYRSHLFYIAKGGTAALINQEFIS